MELQLLFTLMPPLRKPVVAVDLLLRESPSEWRRRLKKRLLSRVDYFIHYFKDLTYYDKFYGIGPDRSGYVAFKPNFRYRQDYRPSPEGDYVLCVGWSLRDYDTFFDAVATLPYPAAIPRPNFPQLRAHGSRFSRGIESLPRQVRVLDHDWAYSSLVPIIGGARLVVLPILKSPYYPAGLSLYLDSMLMGKCVVISEGPGVSDLLTNQALMVPPEDPERLAGAIQRAWEDDTLRKATAEAGYRYARSLGGEPEFLQRVLAEAVQWLGRRSPAPPPATRAAAGEYSR